MSPEHHFCMSWAEASPKTNYLYLDARVFTFFVLASCFGLKHCDWKNTPNLNEFLTHHSACAHPSLSVKAHVQFLDLNIT